MQTEACIRLSLRKTTFKNRYLSILTEICSVIYEFNGGDVVRVEIGERDFHFFALLFIGVENLVIRRGRVAFVVIGGSPNPDISCSAVGELRHFKVFDYRRLSYYLKR